MLYIAACEQLKLMEKISLDVKRRRREENVNHVVMRMIKKSEDKNCSGILIEIHHFH